MLCKLVLQMVWNRKLSICSTFYLRLVPTKSNFRLNVNTVVLCNRIQFSYQTISEESLTIYFRLVCDKKHIFVCNSYS